MTPLAWRILSIFIERAPNQGGWDSVYLAAWTLGTLLGEDAATIQAAPTRYNPRNEYEAALKELLDLGLVEEMPMLGERFQLVVKKA